MTAISKGEREMVELLAQYGGIALAEIETEQRTPTAQGYYKAIVAMIDAGWRYAYNDNQVDGKLTSEGAADEREIVEALAKHSNYSSEWLETAAADEGAEGKAGDVAAMAAGYSQACKAMAAAGFKGAWVDSRMQPVGNHHGYMAKNSYV